MRLTSLRSLVRLHHRIALRIRLPRPGEYAQTHYRVRPVQQNTVYVNLKVHTLLELISSYDSHHVHIIPSSSQLTKQYMYSKVRGP